MKGTPAIMNMLNDVAWHTMQVNRLSDMLNKLGVSDKDIEAFLDDYQKFIELAYTKVSA